MPCRPLALDCLSVSCHCRHTSLTTIYKDEEGEVGISESVAAADGALGLCKVLCWLPLIAKNTSFLPTSARQELHSLLHTGLPSPHRVTDPPMATIHPHWCHIASTVAYLGSLAYYATLGDAFDHDQ